MRKILIPILLITVLWGCSGNKINQNLPTEKKMELGNQYFAQEEYRKAIPYFTDVAFERNSIYTAEAQLKLADCYYNQEKYADALFEYKEFIRLFPDYEDIDRAYFRIGVCYFEQSLPAHYDQTETNQALDAFQKYLEKFPRGTNRQKALDYIQKCNYKLLEKKYQNGRIYYKTYDYSSALLYLNEIIELGNTNELDKMSLYYAARIYLERENMSKVEETLKKMKNKYPEAKETEKISDLYTDKIAEIE
ncbi:MAG: outer membrane protein assembly factor BamD [Candidatus Cloacimonadota bacterium]|nr:outer membrane protein assembly factor BamD [Candidatus Cloacimonadota bacterium]